MPHYVSWRSSAATFVYCLQQCNYLPGDVVSRWCRSWQLAHSLASKFKPAAAAAAAYSSAKMIDNGSWLPAPCLLMYSFSCSCIRRLHSATMHCTSLQFYPAPRGRFRNSDNCRRSIATVRLHTILSISTEDNKIQSFICRCCLLINKHGVMHCQLSQALQGGPKREAIATDCSHL